MTITPAFIGEQIGDATLYRADCLDVLRSLPDASVDAVITDPPYGVDLAYASHTDTADAYFPLMRAFMAEAQRIVSPKGFILLTPGMKHLNWWYREFPPLWTIPWIKPNQCSWSRLGGANVWEPFLIWGKPARRVPRDVMTVSIKRQRDTGDHPCPKSYEAWAQIMSMVLPQDSNALVCDPFVGSGTTAVVCAQYGWRCIAVEKDAGYYAIARERIQQASASTQCAEAA